LILWLLGEREAIKRLLCEEFDLVPKRDPGRRPLTKGKDVRIGENVQFGNDVIIGDNVRIGNRVVLGNVSLADFWPRKMNEEL